MSNILLYEILDELKAQKIEQKIDYCLLKVSGGQQAKVQNHKFTYSAMLCPV